MRGYKTAKEFAEKNDIPQSTYQLHETGKRGLSRHDTLQLYAEKLGVSASWLIEGIGRGPYDRDAAPTNSVATRDKSASLRKGQAGGYFEELTLEVPIIGTVKAGVWMEATQLPESEWAYMSLPADLRYPGVPRIAFKNEGDSMNKTFPDGSTLVCVRVADTEEEPQHGHYVIVERENKDGLVEATCKRLMTQAGKPILMPESTNERHQPIPLNGDKSVAEIRVIARVINVVSKVL